jgi:predicted HNH restriction endonuclease
MTCPVCQFEATIPQQIELHHPTDIDSGPKNQRNSIYYRTTDLKPMCANCHSIQHRTGERLISFCGKWKANRWLQI